MNGKGSRKLNYGLKNRCRFEFVSSRSHLAEVHEFMFFTPVQMLPHYQNTMHLVMEPSPSHLLSVLLSF